MHSGTRETAGGKSSQSLCLSCLHPLQPAVETLQCIVNDKYPVMKLVSTDQRKGGERKGERGSDRREGRERGRGKRSEERGMRWRKGKGGGGHVDIILNNLIYYRHMISVG